jgi:3-oxoadipate enol-lactonase
MGAGIQTLTIAGDPQLVLDAAGAGPVLLCLHGVGGGRINFAGQLSGLADCARVVALDARGYGDSDDVPGLRAFPDFAADVVRVLDHLGADKAILLGVSMGGRIALDTYGRTPDRVAALVLADTSVGSAAARDPAKIEAFLALRRKPLLEEGKTPADIAPDVARTLAGPHCTPEQFEALLASLAALRTESYLKTLEAVTRYHDFPPFGQVQVPTLVITGEHDPIAPPAMAQAMAQAIPGARYVELAGAGHISNIEAPDAFNAAVRAFVQELAA